MNRSKSSGLSVPAIDCNTPSTTGSRRGRQRRRRRTRKIRTHPEHAACLRLFRCVDSIVNMRDKTGHTLVFTVDDVPLSRVELIIRRCNGVRAPASCCSNASSVHLFCRRVETTVDARSRNSTATSPRIISIRQMRSRRSAAMPSVYAGPRPRPHRSSLVTNKTEA